MSKELKKYRIRATKKPAKNTLLSSVVSVRNEAGEVGYCYINFDAPLVEKVGRVLPRGVCPEDPAALSVRYYPRTNVWLIVAQYVSGESETLLWKTPGRPAWLNFYRNKHHGTSGKKASHSGGSGSCAAASCQPISRAGKEGGPRQAHNSFTHPSEAAKLVTPGGKAIPGGK